MVANCLSRPARQEAAVVGSAVILTLTAFLWAGLYVESRLFVRFDFLDRDLGRRCDCGGREYPPSSSFIPAQKLSAKLFRAVDEVGGPTILATVNGDCRLVADGLCQW